MSEGRAKVVSITGAGGGIGEATPHSRPEDVEIGEVVVRPTAQSCRAMTTTRTAGVSR